MGGTKTATQTSTSTPQIPQELRGPLINRAQQFLSDDPAQRNLAAQSLVLDPQRFGQIGSTLAQGAFNQTPTAERPETQALLASLQNQSSQQLAEQNALRRGRFRQGGQNLSGPLLQAETQAAGQADRNLQDVSAQALFNQFNADRANQLANLQGLERFERIPQESGLAFANLFTGNQTTSRSEQPRGLFGK